MARSRCPACGATVDVAQCKDANGFTFPVPLEVHTDASSDADRYRITGHAPLTAEQVAPGSRGDYHPDHRHDCPGSNAGRR